MTHNHDGDAVFWFVIILSSLVLLVVTSGCATTKQSVDIRCEVPQDGKAVAVVAYSLVTK